MFRFLTACFVMLSACEGMVSFDDPELLFGETGGESGVGAATETTRAALTGAELFQQNCSACHGTSGEGSPTWPSSIQGYAPIEPIVVSGRGAMAPMALAVEDIAKVQEFVLTLAPPAEELDGQGLFTRYCSSCHGADASGGNEWPGSIQGYEPIEEIVLNGRGEMAAIPITPEQSQQIQAWLLTLAPSLADLTGPEVYQRLCVTCHGERGEGLPTTGPQLRYDDGPYSIYWTRAGRVTQAYDSDMPTYPEEMISGAQLDEMFAWINDAPHPESGQGLYDQYCTNCHGADGSGGASGQDIRGEGGELGVARDGKGGNNFSDRREYMTSWTNQQLSDAELQIIAGYVNSL